MTPMEACLYLGVRNTFMVPDGEHDGTRVNRRQYNKSFKTLLKTGWEFGGESITAKGDTKIIDDYLEDCKEFPNIACAVFDDFKKDGRYKNIPLEKFHIIMDKLHNNDIKSLQTWMVLYTHEFGIDKQVDEDFQPYINAFDGVIMWTWCEKDVPLIPEKFEIFKKMTPNHHRMFGCYLWNFGEEKEATAASVKWQLDWYRERILQGEAEGVVLHTNTMADLDYEAYDAAISWMEEHGDEEVPDLKQIVSSITKPYINKNTEIYFGVFIAILSI